MAQHIPFFTTHFNSHTPPFPNSPHREQSGPMCVISDLFDITEADWFSSRLDKSPSRNSSLSDPCIHQSPAHDNQSHSPEHPSQTKQVEIELLTPDADKSENSFNVLTAQSENDVFQASLEHQFSLQLPVDISDTMHLENHFPIEEEMPFGHQDLLKYTSLQEESAAKLDEDSTSQEPQDNLISVETLTGTPVSPDGPFSSPKTTESLEQQSIDQILQAIGQPMKLDDPTSDIEIQQPQQVPITATTASEEISFDDLYQAISVDGHPLPDVQSYIAALDGTARLLDTATFEEAKPRPRKKRKISKREAARAASAAEMEREEKLAMLANTKQITDDELLRLKPKKQRRAARFEKPVPSRFCHICCRTPKNVRLVVCCKLKEGICRKVICEKCFEEYEWGNFEEALNTDTSHWVCPHCLGKCPKRAQCTTYQKTNDRLRVSRLKQEGPRNGKRRIRRQMEQRVESGDEKRPRFLLPAVASGEFGGYDVVGPEVGIVEHEGNEIEADESLE